MKFICLALLIILANQAALLAQENQQVTLQSDQQLEQQSDQQQQIEQPEPIKSVALIKLNAYLVDLKSYEANFQQRLSGASRGISETTSGRFIMKRPNRFLWQINTPFEQTIIADGTSIYTIDIDLEQVTIKDIDESIANSPIMLISRENNQLELYFEVIELNHKSDLNKKSQRVTFLLKPLDSSSNFEFIQLGFNDGILQLIELNDSLGQVTSITMTNVRNNPIISEQQFIYQPIEDFDVIDSRVQLIDEQ